MPPRKYSFSSFNPMCERFWKRLICLRSYVSINKLDLPITWDHMQRLKHWVRFQSFEMSRVHQTLSSKNCCDLGDNNCVKTHQVVSFLVVMVALLLPYIDFALTLPLDLALTLPSPIFDIASTLPWPRPGKRCKISSSGKFREMECAQNSVINDKGSPEICVFNIGVVWWNPQI